MTMSLSQAWRIAGEDLRYLPLIDRKLRLPSVLPKSGEGLLYLGIHHHSSPAAASIQPP
jgi:hypothetical protein